MLSPLISVCPHANAGTPHTAAARQRFTRFIDRVLRKQIARLLLKRSEIFRVNGYYTTAVPPPVKQNLIAYIPQSGQSHLPSYPLPWYSGGTLPVLFR